MRGKLGLFARNPPPFSPSSIGGLSGWWDASDAAKVFDAVVDGSQVAPDGTVARWEDKSGNGHHFAQDTGSLAPVYKTSIKNSLSVLRFDGANDRMESSWLFQDVFQVTQGTFFVVANAASVATNNAANDSNALIFGAGGGHGFVELRSNNTAASFGYDQSNSFKTSTIAYTPGEWKLFGALHTGSSLLFRLNSGSPSSSALGVRQFADQLVDLGTNYDRTRFFHGDIGEIVAYNVALSTSDREAVESYLMTKWAIT